MYSSKKCLTEKQEYKFKMINLNDYQGFFIYLDITLSFLISSKLNIDSYCNIDLSKYIK